MNFDLEYTKEQQDFRREVRAWLEQNAKLPPELGKVPLEGRDTTRAQYAWAREFRSKVGHKGWLHPMLPPKYGGGGLSLDHDIIIKEELSRYKVPSASSPGDIALAYLYIYATEEQKQRFLKPMVQGDIVVWQLWTEPEAGVDLASIKSLAVKDGDDFIINGTKCYISGIYEADYLNTLVVTDPKAPRHNNLGQFFFPATLPGIRWEYQELITRSGQNFVFFDNVRVSREYLVGGETNGWRVTQSSLEMEHGTGGSVVGRDTLVQDLISLWREGRRDSLAQGADAEEQLVNAYIRTRLGSLIARRNFWMFNTKRTQTYQGSQNEWWGRETHIRNAEHLLELLGPYSLTNDLDWGFLEGRVELAQRGASMATHGNGSYEIDRVITARRIGLSRTKEVAAPTH